MNDLIDYCEGKEYLLEFKETKFAEWNGSYEFIYCESLSEQDDWRLEYYTFKNSTTGLVIYVFHSDQWYVAINKNTHQLCKPLDIDDDGIFMNTTSFIDVDIIDEEGIREDRWYDRCELIIYSEATESHVSSKIDSVSQIVENRDLVRFIADYL